MAYSSYTPPKDEIKLLREKIEFNYIGGYLFWGEEEYLKNYYREVLKKKVRDLGFEEFNLISVSFEKGDTFDDIEASLDTPPVFSTVKLVEVTGLDILTLKKEEEKRLLEIAHSRAEDTVLIFTFYSDELDLKPRKTKERAIIKKLSEDLFFVEFPRQSKEKLLSWTDKIFSSQSLHISDVNIVKMIELCDYSMTRLKSESDKLVCRAKQNSFNQVPSEWVSEMVKPSSENVIFELGDAIALLDKKRAFDVFENVVAQNIEPTVIFSVIARTVVGLQVLFSAIETGARAYDVAGDCGFQPWLVEKYAKALTNRTRIGLENSVALLAKCDRELKGEGKNRLLSLNTLIAGLFQENCK